MVTCLILGLMNSTWIGSGTISSTNQEIVISQVHSLTDLIDGRHAQSIARTKLLRHPGTDEGLLQVAERTADCMVVPWQCQEQGYTSRQLRRPLCCGLEDVNNCARPVYAACSHKRSQWTSSWVQQASGTKKWRNVERFQPYASHDHIRICLQK